MSAIRDEIDALEREVEQLMVETGAGEDDPACQDCGCPRSYHARRTPHRCGVHPEHCKRFVGDHGRFAADARAASANPDSPRVLRLRAWSFLKRTQDEAQKIAPTLPPGRLADLVFKIANLQVPASPSEE